MALGAAFTLTGSGCIVYDGWDDGVYVEEVREMDIPHVAGVPIEVTSRNGYIEIIQADREDIHISAKVRAKTEERLEAIAVLLDRDTPEEGSGLTISAQFAEERKRGESVSFRIEIPDADGVTASTSNGSILLEGLAGHADLRSSNGKIVIHDHDGGLKLRSSNGAISADGVSGEIVARTSNGRIEIVDADDDVDAETSNGSVTVVQHPDSEGVLRIQSSNGSIRITLSDRIAGELTARTSNASVGVSGIKHGTVDQPHKTRATIHFDDSDERHTLTTSNGSITIKSAN